MIKKEFASCQVDFNYPDDALFDICCVDMPNDNFRYRLVCVYRPPGVSLCNQADAKLLISGLSSLLSPSYIFFVAGDLNLPHINWNTSTSPIDGVHNLLLDLFEDYGLSQIITVPGLLAKTTYLTSF